MVCPMTMPGGEQTIDGLGVGALVRQRRLARGWSQVDLAERAGSSQRQISRLEQMPPGALPRRATMEALRDALGITLAEFYRAAGEAPPLAAEPAPVTPVPAAFHEAFPDQAHLSDAAIMQWAASEPDAASRAALARYEAKLSAVDYLRLLRRLYRAYSAAARLALESELEIENDR